MKTIRDIPLRKQTVFLRVDFNVPMDENQDITEDGRIKAALPTIEYLLEKQCMVVLASHLGRPDGKVVEELRMKPVAQRLSDYLGQEVKYVDDCVGKEAEEVKAAMKPGDMLLLENLRFYPQEEENDLHFAEKLALGIDVYITDAFGVVHRKHASTFALPSLVFDKGIGFLIQEEIEALDRIAKNPEKPLAVVIGGIKISDKVDVIRNLAPKADVILTGGGVANAFMKAMGMGIGASKVEDKKDGEEVDFSSVALEIWTKFQGEKPQMGMTLPNGDPLPKIVTPLDCIAASSREEGAETKVIEIGKDEMPQDWMFLDIGPKTRELYAQILGHANSIFWNGPLGLFEMDEYAAGSKAVAEAIANSKGYAVLGGGDTEVVTEKFGLKGRYSHASTGGGASLTYLAGNELPGLMALE
ncbi:MAG: phosphoglycerate kinase [Candidatus Kerfeldbacteria bacterium]